MAKKIKRKTHIKKPRKVAGATCLFCEKATQPDYLNIEELSVFLTDRAKIVGVDYSALCAKHQRRLSIAVKRARHLALLPFRPKI